MKVHQMDEDDNSNDNKCSFGEYILSALFWYWYYFWHTFCNHWLFFYFVEFVSGQRNTPYISTYFLDEYTVLNCVETFTCTSFECFSIYSIIKILQQYSLLLCSLLVVATVTTTTTISKPVNQELTIWSIAINCLQMPFPSTCSRTCKMNLLFLSVCNH